MNPTFSVSRASSSQLHRLSSATLNHYKSRGIYASQRLFHQGPGKLMAVPGVASRTTAAAFKKKPVVVDASKGKGITNNIAKMDKWSLPQSSKVILPDLGLENFTEENINTVFAIPSSLKKKFGTSLVPKSLTDYFSLAQEAGLLLRKCTLDLNRHIDEKAEKNPAPLILEGKAGLGKSALLYQLVSQKILSQDWLVVYVPSVKECTNGSQAYSASKTPGVFIQPTVASGFLESVLRLNETLLEKINLSENTKIGNTDYTTENTLHQIVLRGSQNPMFATACLNIFFDTISKQTSVPVLLALDEVNAIYGTSAYHNQDSKKVASTDLMFVRLLADFVEQKRKLAKGIVVGATSWVERELVSTEFGSPSPRDVSDKIVSTKTQSGAPIDKFHVPAYNFSEAKAVTEFFKEASILPEVELPQETEQRFVMASANPLRFFKLSTQLF